MEKLILAVVLLATCSAKSEDLSGKVFVFPRETASDHVKLLTQRNSIESSTVCLRFFTDLTRSYGIFSLATSQFSNAFLLYKDGTGDIIELAIKDNSMLFKYLTFPPNTWHSICATMDIDSGLGQLWMDGKPTVKRYMTTGSITSSPITVLGQEQDSFGGDFDRAQSFIGMITQVHMWDRILAPWEIKRYTAGESFTPGNIFNWADLDFEIVGKVSIEDESSVM